MLTASSTSVTETMGKMGPKISSLIRESWAVTPVTTVGAMYKSFSSLSPPMTVCPWLLLSMVSSRCQFRKLMILYMGQAVEINRRDIDLTCRGLRYPEDCSRTTPVGYP